jgi:hypothetical protein
MCAGTKHTNKIEKHWCIIKLVLHLHVLTCTTSAQMATIPAPTSKKIIAPARDQRGIFSSWWNRETGKRNNHCETKTGTVCGPVLDTRGWTAENMRGRWVCAYSSPWEWKGTRNHTAYCLQPHQHGMIVFGPMLNLWSLLLCTSHFNSAWRSPKCQN